MRGYALIFNHNNFKINESERVGTEHDVLALKNVFEKFNIYYEIYPDFTFYQIATEVERLKRFDFTNYSYFAVIILTHGDNNNILCAKDQKYNLFELIINPIVDNNPTLVDKPKIFIIQACKGKNSHSYFHKNIDATVEGSPKIAIPTKTNMCLVFSTFEGYVSERDPHFGGQFIQSLCKHIDKYGTRDTIEVIMRSVAKELIQNIYQVPMFISTLTEEFYFCEKPVYDVTRTLDKHLKEEQKRIIKGLSECFMEQHYRNKISGNHSYSNRIEKLQNLDKQIERKKLEKYEQYFKVKLKPSYLIDSLIDDKINNDDVSIENQLNINHNILKNSQEIKDEIFRVLEEKLEMKKQEKSEQFFTYKLKPINQCDLTNKFNSIGEDSIIDEMSFDKKELNSRFNEITAANPNKEQLFNELEDKLEKRIIIERNKEFLKNRLKLIQFKQLLQHNSSKDEVSQELNKFNQNKTTLVHPNALCKVNTGIISKSTLNLKSYCEESIVYDKPEKTKLSMDNAKIKSYQENRKLSFVEFSEILIQPYFNHILFLILIFVIIYYYL